MCHDIRIYYLNLTHHAKRRIWGTFFFIIIVGFTVSEIIIISGDEAVTKGEGSCPSIPEYTGEHFTGKPGISVWHAQFQADFNSDIRILKNCPTSGVRVEIGDKLVALSQLKDIDTWDIADCFGNRIFTWQKGAIKTEFDDASTISDASGNIIAYTTWVFHVNAISKIISLNGSTIAVIDSDWDITKKYLGFNHQNNHSSHPANDFRLLYVIAGLKTLPKKDVCYKYFWNVAYVFIIMASLAALVICATFVKFVRRILGPYKLQTEKK